MSDELPELKKVVLPGDEDLDPQEVAGELLPGSPETADDPNDDPSALDVDGAVPTDETDVSGVEPVIAEGVKPPPGDGDGPKDEEGEEVEGRMGVLEHLQELRRCVTKVVLAVLVGFLPCYAVAAELFSILMKPMSDAMSKVSSANTALHLSPEFFSALKESLTTLMGQKGPEFADQTAYFVAALETALQKVVVNQGQFIYTSPPEAFFAEVKVAFVAGFFLVSPYIFYQLWKFVAPGLYAHERRWIWPVALISAIFFVTGGCFGYFVVFPVGFEFFAQFSSEAISFMPKLSEYLDFALKLLIAFGISFELPVFIFFLSVMGLVTGMGLLKKSKYFILIAFIVGAILTPPDPVSQALMAGPLIILYALGVIIAFIFGKKKPKPAQAAVGDDAGDGAGDDAAA